MPSLGINAGSPRYKTNALTTEPKSWLSDAVVRGWLYTRSYAKSTLCRYIGESVWPVPLPSPKEATIYDDGKPFKAKLMSNPGQEHPILRHDSPNKVKHSCKIPCAFAGNRSWVAPVQDQCSNHWAKELTLWRSCHRLIIYYQICKIYLM